MIKTYKINLEGNVLKVGFGEEVASNDQLVQDVTKLLAEVFQGNSGGTEPLKINGAASLPIACTIASKVAHLYPAIGVFDPKLGKYVVAISHHPRWCIGDLLD